jgi:hypothetical protein
MKAHRLIAGSLASHRYLQYLAAIWARRLDVTVSVQGGADPERIPRAIRIPPLTAGMHSIRTGNRRERIRHMKLASVMQDQCMVIVKATPPRPDKFCSRTLGRRNLTGRRRPPELHKEAVRCVAKRTLIFIHPSTVSLQHAPS